MNIAQETKIAHLDTRKAKDGHIVVSKDDQAKLFTKQVEPVTKNLSLTIASNTVLTAEGKNTYG